MPRTGKRLYYHWNDGSLQLGHTRKSSVVGLDRIKSGGDRHLVLANPRCCALPQASLTTGQSSLHTTSTVISLLPNFPMMKHIVLLRRLNLGSFQ